MKTFNIILLWLLLVLQLVYAIVEFCEGSIIFGFPKDYKLPGSWGLVEIVNGSQTVEEFLNEYNGIGELNVDGSIQLGLF